MSEPTTAAGRKAAPVPDPAYDAFLGRVRARFAAAAEPAAPLFATDAAGLFETYLAALPAEARPVHDCAACRRFVEAYGGLVTIDDRGRTRSAVWPPDAEGVYAAAAAALAGRAEAAAVTGVFLSSDEVWGKPTAGGWTHLALAPPAASRHAHPLLSPAQAAAAKRHDYETVRRALDEFPRRAVEQAVAILKTDALYRAEKVLGPAEWLLALHDARDAAKGPASANVVWRAAAAAPPGFCRPRASMTGTLLEDLVAGVPFEEASRKFAAKMHPLRYQRPQAAPTAGNIARAEKVVERLGLRPSLARRFARLEEVEAVWRPKAPHPNPVPPGGVFSHLVPKPPAAAAADLGVPPQTLTWDKFRRTVLPTAEAIELRVPPGNREFGALATAADPLAPPLLQWDRPDRRNPVSTYVWVGGSPASQWGLKAGEYRRVTAVALQPWMWGPDENAFPHQGRGVFFLLDGAKDSRRPHACLFPEILKAELHEIRPTVEAFSRSAELAGREEASACGLALTAGQPWSGVRLRVTGEGSRREFDLDRWD